MRAVVLGGGVVGEAVAWDLSRVAPVAHVTVVDADAARLGALRTRLGVETQQADLRDLRDVEARIAGADVTIGTLPSTMALPVIAHMARTGRRHVDVSFLAEDPRRAHDDAVASGATVVYDCGVAPGLSHVLVGHGARNLTQVRATIDVGGLPVDPQPPFFYKAPFAPADVIEEYTRPARLVRDGVAITLPALSEPEAIDVPGVGSLEAFNTDGLRSLIDTIPAESLVERTLRYPGHLAAMQVLADAGLLSSVPVDVTGTVVTPREVTSHLLFRQWRYAPGERDLTVLRVDVSGRAADGQHRHEAWLMVDRRADNEPLSSMARTTGFPAAIVARWLVEGRIDAPGVHPPERLGLDGHGPALLAALAARGVRVRHDGR
ncbi:MAG TPA: saccharopine dehydrogenase C-terminal domain-containing protein [Luteitalea sp.]|nr:saccharopine dehydrogenase C-terminal domain-containing protein [Luteitalea sp.]